MTGRAASDGGGQLPLYADLLEALAQPGCALCLLAAGAVDRYIEAWTYELFTDHGSAEQLAAARGFCTRHTWEIASRRATFALSVAYADVLRRTLKDLEEGAPHFWPEASAAERRRRWWHLPGGRRGAGLHGAAAVERAAADRWRACLVCQARVQEEHIAYETLERVADRPEFQQQFAMSSGFCLVHFGGVLAVLGETQRPETVVTLQRLERDCLERTLVQVRELIRKHDYRFADEPEGEEMRSWQLAAELVSGRHGLW